MKIEHRIQPNEIGHEFLKYVLRKNVRDKIWKKIEKKIYLTKEIEDERYYKFIEQEYFNWAKKFDVPRDLVQEGFESYMED